MSACTAHVGAFTLDALFATGSVLIPGQQQQQQQQEGPAGDGGGRGRGRGRGGDYYNATSATNAAAGGATSSSSSNGNGHAFSGGGGGLGLGLRQWSHVYMIDSDELGEVVGGCCPRGCGRFLGLRPLADLGRALQPYNSVAAFLLQLPPAPATPPASPPAC